MLGANPKGARRQPIIRPTFPKNYMEMKKIGPRGGPKFVDPPRIEKTDEELESLTYEYDSELM